MLNYLTNTQGGNLQILLVVSLMAQETNPSAQMSRGIIWNISGACD